jgi:hypothetical protein
MPKPPHRGRPHRVPASAVSGFIDEARVDKVLAVLVPDRDDRAFLVRCMLAEGPAHHRGANFVLLCLIGELAERLGSPRRSAGRSAPVPMRLPPHLEHEVEDATYPLALPLEPLEGLATRGARDVEAMIDCLTDGPPQHAVANVVMVALLERLRLALEEPPA